MTPRGIIVLMLGAVLAGVGFAAIQQRGGREELPDDGSELIVMLGDSITEAGDWAELFPERRIFNAGFSGHRTEQLVPIAAEVAKSQPRAVFVLAGINDIFADLPPSSTVDHLLDIVEAFESRAPDTHIVVQTVLPNGERSGEVRATNAAIRDAATSRGIDVLDLHPPFDDGSGALRPAETYDGIHLSAAGYDRWAALLRPRYDDLDETSVS